MREGQLLRESDGQCLVPRVWRAVGAWERLRGLLGHARLKAGEGMLIDRCGMIHTLGMGYALDLAFLDGDGRVCKTVAGVAPARMAASLRAAMTLELPAGGLAFCGLNAGDRLIWRETT